MNIIVNRSDCVCVCVCVCVELHIRENLEIIKSVVIVIHFCYFVYSKPLQGFTLLMTSDSEHFKTVWWNF